MAEDVRYFQFLAGPRNGEVVIFDKVVEEDGMIFVCFKDGSRCNESLILPLDSTDYQNQLMAEVDSPSNLWVIETIWVGREEEKWEQGSNGELHCVQPFIEGKRKIIPHPPKKTKSRFGQINNANTPAPQVNTLSVPEIKTQQQSKETVSQSNLSDPVYLMCEKAKKFDTSITMNLMVSLPKKTFYNVAKESFENGGQKVIEYIIENLDDQLIKDSLKRALLESYEDNPEPYELESPVIGEAMIVEENN